MTLIERGDNQLRVLAISGSLRKASFNTGLLRASQELAPDSTAGEQAPGQPLLATQPTRSFPAVKQSGELGRAALVMSL